MYYKVLERRVLRAIAVIFSHVSAWVVNRTALVYAGGIVLLIFLFVALPGVWSRDPDRRRDAFAVLDRILHFFRR